MGANRIALPETVDEAIAALVGTPGAQLLAGGTDFCVEVNFDHRRPQAVVALRRVNELKQVRITPERVVVGAGTTYTDMCQGDLAQVVPALAVAARTVGSPQIRNAGTLGGNVATASPAGDTLPLLAALDAEVHLRGPGGDRSVPLRELVTGVKRTVIAQDEVVVDVSFDRPRGPQQFLKVGTRNAMVISIASVAVVLDRPAASVRVGLGSVAPVPLRAASAETFVAQAIDWTTMRIEEAEVARFAALVGEAASPITDHRSTSEYRRRAVEVIARRGLERCLRDVA